MGGRIGGVIGLADWGWRRPSLPPGGRPSVPGRPQAPASAGLPRAGSHTLPRVDIKEEQLLGEAAGGHWYYMTKGRALRAFLGGITAGEVLDVGAGSGIFSRQLLDNGICGAAVCFDPFYEAEREESHGGRPIRFVRSLGRVSQDLILMMDVLEHVDDDVGLLREVTATMPSSGRVVITVPAFQCLWSGHDVFLEHRRRYTVRSLERVVRAAGLEPVRSRYFFGSLLPIVAAVRVAQRLMMTRSLLEPRSSLAPYPRWLNSLLTGIHGAERRLLFPVNRLAGLTIFSLCRR